MGEVGRSVLVVCATHRDRRELARIGVAEQCIFHDYASLELELIAGTPSHVARPIRDPDHEIEALVARARAAGVRGVLSTDDYPGTALAAIVAARLGLPGPPPRATLLAQHKHRARLIGRQSVPEATPEFELSTGDEPLLVGAGPVFVKPCKSFFSIGARRVPTPQAFRDAARGALLPAEFFDIFDRLCREHAGIDATARQVLVERFVQGAQCTVEGVRRSGATHILGVVDSVYCPNASSFDRFEYPSSLPIGVQERMAAIATRIIEALGFDDGGFNVEMIWDGAADRVWVIEVNPRSSSQFADLFEKVDGVNTYALLLDLALGKPIRRASRGGRHRFAASCVLRRFSDARVDAAPTPEDVAGVEAAEPDARVEILATPGGRLSSELQDGVSYRYAIVDLGGRDRSDVLRRLQRVEEALPFRFSDAANEG